MPQSHSRIDIDLPPGHVLWALPGTPASLEADLTVRTRRFGGPLNAALQHSSTTSTTRLIEIRNNTESNRHIMLTPPLPGDIGCLDLQDDEIYLNPGVLIAFSGKRHLRTRWAGIASAVAGQGLLRLNAKGTGRIWFRASSLVATGEGGTALSHNPIFNDHPDYEPMDWSEFTAPVSLIISGRGALFCVPIDGEQLIDVDTIVAFNKNLTITPVAADGSSAAKRLANIHQPIYRFTGCGNLWCQSGRTREFGRLLKPHLNNGAL